MKNKKKQAEGCKGRDIEKEEIEEEEKHGWKSKEVGSKLEKMSWGNMKIKPILKPSHKTDFMILNWVWKRCRGENEDEERQIVKKEIRLRH